MSDSSDYEDVSANSTDDESVDLLAPVPIQQTFEEDDIVDEEEIQDELDVENDYLPEEQLDEEEEGDEEIEEIDEEPIFRQQEEEAAKALAEEELRLQEESSPEIIDLDDFASEEEQDQLVPQAAPRTPRTIMHMIQNGTATMEEISFQEQLRAAILASLESSNPPETPVVFSVPSPEMTEEELKKYLPIKPKK